MQDDRRMIEEMRQPYRTPSERAADRKANAQHGMFNTSPERPDDAPAPKIVLNIWQIQSQKGGPVAYVRCASRSGAKIFMTDAHGWKPPYHTDVIAPENLPEGAEVLDAVFETVPEFAARVERENKEKRR